MATVEVVHIYLSTQDALATEWIHALFIPRKYIERLTLRPLKWLRFATFTVCGAKGDLSAIPGGKIVDCENISFDDLADKYYYTPDGKLVLPVLLISSNDASKCTCTISLTTRRFNDQCTSSVVIPRRIDFRERICGRDKSFVITGEECDGCDAAHITPGSEVRSSANLGVPWAIAHLSLSTLLMLFVTAPVYTNHCHSLLKTMLISTGSRMECFCAKSYMQSLAWPKLGSLRYAKNWTHMSLSHLYLTYALFRLPTLPWYPPMFPGGTRSYSTQTDDVTVHETIYGIRSCPAT